MTTCQKCGRGFITVTDYARFCSNAMCDYNLAASYANVWAADKITLDPITKGRERGEMK